MHQDNTIHLAAFRPLPRQDDWLICDLDGTLIHTDLLDESFWAACGRSMKTPFRALHALATAGRPGLKTCLADIAPIDPNALPYNADVLNLLTDWRAAGGRTALVTAADDGLARRIARHLGLFDAVQGSTPGCNLKGAAKADYILAQYGPDVTYAGDSEADLAVWSRVDGAVTVGATPRLRARAEGSTGSGNVIHLAPRGALPPEPGQGLPPLLRALRPHQWLKNLLVFLPMLAGHDFSAATLTLCLLAMAAFSLVASSVYVLNDLLDLASDRAHPRKRNRPFASGALSLRTGLFMVPGLLLAGLGLAALTGPLFLGTVALYFAATLAYSFRLKRFPIVDICALAALYAMRVVAGGAATGIPLSAWLMAFILFFFFSLAAIKRQAELIDTAAAGKATAPGRGYRTSDLPLVSSMALAAGYLSVLVMALYVDSTTVRDLYAHAEPLWGICAILLFWISRIALITSRGEMHDDPVVYAARDRTSLACFALILGLFAAGSI